MIRAAGFVGTFAQTARALGPEAPEALEASVEPPPPQPTRSSARGTSITPCRTIAPCSTARQINDRSRPHGPRGLTLALSRALGDAAGVRVRRAWLRGARSPVH